MGQVLSELSTPPAEQDRRDRAQILHSYMDGYFGPPDRSFDPTLPENWDRVVRRVNTYMRAVRSGKVDKKEEAFRKRVGGGGEGQTEPMRRTKRGRGDVFGREFGGEFGGEYGVKERDALGRSK